MLPLILPENYESPIDLMESQRAIRKKSKTISSRNWHMV